MTATHNGLAQFAEEIRQQVISSSEIEGEESFRPDQFTELMIEHLIDAGELDDGMVCSHRARGIQVNGYAVSEDEECLDLLLTEYTGEVPPGTLGRTAVSSLFRRGKAFLTKALDSYYRSVEEASPVFDLALRVHDLRDALTQVRFFLLTDAVARADQLKDHDMGAIRISYQVWDLERLHRCLTSGRRREAVEIDLEATCGRAIPCLPMPIASDDYVTYLAVFPGDVLVQLYGDHGPRLLERNVRAFLQARGKVNAGIRQTILKEPHMFLAYNNGLSATAEAVSLVTLPGGVKAIKGIRDFQIVNGAQTTASIFHAARKDHADVSRIHLQVKLTVLADAEQMDEIVPRISEYANSQNKIQTADFSANDPFHRKTEELSRTIWAPAVGGTQRQTRWYYERARGQYLDDRERERTPAKKRAFDAMHPTSQRFSKTDLAKFENTWNQLPHLVSRGAQKNFREFTVLLKERDGFEPDQQYFERLIAKAILFRTAEKLVQSQQYGGYRANIVTYTLARIAYETEQRIDLDRIWREQSLIPALKQAITEVSQEAHDHIVHPSGGENITEWCKKDACWKKFRARPISLPAALTKELIPVGREAQLRVDRGVDGADARDGQVIEQVMAVSGEAWLRLSSWAKETGNLQSWQRGIAYGIGLRMVRGQEPSRKQAVQGVTILQEAGRLGFKL